MADDRIARRSFLKGAGAAGTAVAAAVSGQLAPAAGAKTLNHPSRPAPDKPGAAPQQTAREPLLTLSAAEAAFLGAAYDAFIPADKLSPSGSECGLVTFIDRQLAGPYGQGDHFYLKGPFPDGEPSQAWQMPKPADIYRTAIYEVNRYAADAHGANFAQLTPDRQDETLKALESGKAKLRGSVESKAFFALLLQNTMEGFFADPLYGGNRDMAGWSSSAFRERATTTAPSSRARRALSAAARVAERPAGSGRGAEHSGSGRRPGRFRMDGRHHGGAPHRGGLERPCDRARRLCDTPNDFATTFDQDELRYMWRHHQFENVAHDTLTFRNQATRSHCRCAAGIVPAGDRMGGAGVHWNGHLAFPA